MGKFSRILCLLGAVLASISMGVSAKVVLLLELDWSSQKVLTHVVGELMQSKGIEVDYVSFAADGQWYQLVYGHADVQIEVWQGSMAAQFDKLVKNGKIIDGGTHQALTREGWWYPDYVEALCPGLPDWTALKACSALFSDDEESQGIYISGPWVKPDRARIRALGLDFRVREIPTGDELWQVFVRLFEKKKVFVIFNWTPNWVETLYKGKFVEFPEYSEACEFEPAWGVNKKYLWDCGNPKDGWLKKATSKYLAGKSLCALDIVRSFSLSNQEIALAAALIDIDHLSVEQAAKQWLDVHSERLEQWHGHASCN
ncbi:ABC transporter substrate-binding protein [Shewanella violacea]|uniref:Glycine betaine ABC transporter, substrate-binding protein n=1 Tax=Shewanella violacea (strain JCM 10179 / CIP 106290 / LMG 19151 / DSS12) TaxID=637905 RepID=D4ZCZ1_SHEVD|nr:ABC transporter substrate-binding protein [Shewanella violacea]BAJ03886.1 glycine betaine ABC transporter, substrate-binding protein [Shewanella violacea DSS12]